MVSVGTFTAQRWFFICYFFIYCLDHMTTKKMCKASHHSFALYFLCVCCELHSENNAKKTSKICAKFRSKLIFIRMRSKTSKNTATTTNSIAAKKFLFSIMNNDSATNEIVNWFAHTPADTTLANYLIKQLSVTASILGFNNIGRETIIRMLLFSPSLFQEIAVRMPMVSTVFFFCFFSFSERSARQKQREKVQAECLKKSRTAELTPLYV